MNDSDSIQFTVRLYPREIVYWDDPRHPRHKEQAMAEQPENHDQLTPEQQALHDKLEAAARERSPIDPNQSDEAKRAAFADRFHRETKALADANRRQDAIAATGFYCPTEAEIAQGHATVSEVTPLPPPPTGGLSFASPEIRAHLASMDPNTAALVAQVEERDKMHGAIARARAVLSPLVPSAPDDSIETLAHAVASRLGYFIRERDEVRAAHQRTQAKLLERDATIQRKVDREDAAWGLIANASGGDWSKQSPEWIAAAERWRDQYGTPTMHDAPAAPSRHGKEEIVQLRRQVDELTRQRDAAEERFQEANHLHGETSAALSAMTIKWLNLGNEARALLLRVGEAPPPGHRRGDVAVLRIENRRMHEIVAANNDEFAELRRQIFQLTQEAAKRRLRFDECEAACWEAIEAVRDAGVGFWSERNVDVEHAVTLTINGLSKLLAETQAQLQVADADRVPLRMDLDAARADLEHAKPLIEAALALGDDITPGLNDDAANRIRLGRIDRLCDAVKAYRASADPGSDGMPF